MQLQELVDTVDGLLAKKDDRRLRSMLSRHTAQELAHVINRLTNGKRKTFALLPPEIQAEVVLRLTDRSKGFVLPRISDHTIARFLHFNEEDDAADLLQFIAEERRPVILGHLKPDKRAKLEKLLTFDPETAGGLMDLNFISVGTHETLKDVAARVREHVATNRQTPLVVVRERDGLVSGFVPYKTLMLGQPSRTAQSAMHALPTIAHHIDQEKIVKQAMRERGEVFGVVDDHGHFLGAIHLKDLLKVAQMEATEDVLKFAGVSPEEEMLGPARTAIRMRYKWLIVNLLTAFLASAVVSLFEGTIDRLPYLAIYMPIVAGMGGNAGTQTLAVAVRGLALSDANRKQRLQLVLKEALTGLFNGLINGIIVAGVVTLSRGNAPLGIILCASMAINLVAAGIAGALIPLTLRALRVDPAVASAVFVTTVTDCLGFFVFLGLATLFLI